MRILALDVGNTSVAAAGFASVPDGPPAWTTHRVRGADVAAEIEWWTRTVTTLAPERVVVGAVHGFGAALVAALRRDRAVDFHEQAATFPLACALPAPVTVGVDRLAAALAAVALAPEGAFCVNAGTAITVDWVDATPAFRGGAIVPGRALQARALRLHTAQLPEIALWQSSPLVMPGTTTEEAIRHGLDVGVPGMVDRLLAALARAANDEMPVFVSGGDAVWLSARLLTVHRVEPWLAARGLAWAAVEARR